MAGEKLIRFLGKVPKVSPELLPNTAAQIATNCKLSSGDLIPYPEPVVAGNTNRTGTLKTIYPLRDNAGNIEWLSWADEVNVALGPSLGENEQRFYYTGDGAPKVSTYELAVQGSGPYPSDYYDLGLPYPTSTPSTTLIPYTAQTDLFYKRDASGVVTISKANHGLRDGVGITVSGFTTIGCTFEKAGSNETGTYDQAANSLSMVCSITSHGVVNGQIVDLEFANHSGYNGAYQAVVIDEDRFAVNMPDAAARTGVLTWTNASTTKVRVAVPTSNPFVEGDVIPIIFESGTIASGSYKIDSISGNNLYIITTTSIPDEGNAQIDLASFNAANAVASVIDDDTFTYFASGFQIDTYRNEPDAKVDLGNTKEARNYLYTWVTPWGEESIGSTPTDDVLVRNGETVRLANLPMAKPSGKNYVRGIRIYRTLATTTGADYFRLATAWFPATIKTIYRASNYVYVELYQPHNLILKDIVKVASSISNGNFEVREIVNPYTFTYYQVGSNTSVSSGGTVYYNVGTNDDPVFYDSGIYDDDVNPTVLGTRLETDNYDPPPDDLKGLVAVQNGILMGFVNNQLYFSELGAPHAWPIAYRRSIEHEIVAIAPIGGSAVVLTKAYPYFVSGSDPGVMSIQRIDANYPCVNARSVVAMDYGVVYASNDGLAVIAFTGQGITLATKNIYDNNTWRDDYDISTIIATYYGNQYVASHSTGGFVYDQTDLENVSLVDTNLQFNAAHYDPIDGYAYLSIGTAGDVYRWDDETQPATTMEWKSKVIKIPSYTNLGAARVIADYAGVTTIWNETDEKWDETTELWNAASPVTFNFWVDKQLKASVDLLSDKMFRLPTGYRSDTFELGIQANVRVRAIHIGETPLSLKEA